MTSLHPGDDHLHYGDYGHCWIAPVGIDQTRWETYVRTHLIEHLFQRVRSHHEAAHAELDPEAVELPPSDDVTDVEELGRALTTLRHDCYENDLIHYALDEPRASGEALQRVSGPWDDTVDLARE